MWKRSLLVGVVALALTIPAAAFAAQRFSDVPVSYTHAGSIGWMADTGITAGCEPGKFCPAEPVTRGQMATFMKRFYDNVVPDPVGLAISKQALGVPGPWGNGVMLEVAITVPGPGILVTRATADFQNETDIDYLSCGLNYGYAVDLAEGDSWRAVNLGDTVRDTCATQAAVRVNSGTHIVRLVTVNASNTTSLYNGSLAASFYSDYAWSQLGTASNPTEAPPEAERRS